MADLAARGRVVHPLYVEQGLAWEGEERNALVNFLEALGSANVRPLTVLSAPARPIYGEHWSLTGQGVPGAETEDAAVELPGRNVILFALAGAWCALHGVEEMAIGSLDANPFPDASPAFFDAEGRALSLGLGRPLRILAPYRGIHKDDLIRDHRQLPLERTLTCLAPRGGRHCGRCNKCHERRTAFQRADVPDPTTYEVPA